MRCFAIGDLHLSFSSDKPMDVFGDEWEKHPEKIKQNWQDTVSCDDIVLIPGDISWAMSLKQAQKDIEFLGTLNGTKIILRGNHDYWWNSLTQVRGILPPSVKAIQNDSIRFGNISVGGTRLWSALNDKSTEQDKKIYARELARLELSLSGMPFDSYKIAMVHYPPFDENKKDTPAISIFHKYGVSEVLYAHLHGKAHYSGFQGTRDGIRYHLVSSDYLNFQPALIYDI